MIEIMTERVDKLPLIHYDENIKENMAVIFFVAFPYDLLFNVNVETFDGRVVISAPGGEQLERPTNFLIQLRNE